MNLMIRMLEEDDIEAACKIVNDDWQSVYAGYVNEELLSDEGCHDRRNRMKADFLSGRLLNYVYEDDEGVEALLSIGDTADADKKGAFEVWRIYISKDHQNRGIGRELLGFAEKKALKDGYKEIVIWAFRENKRAVSFYKKHGYKQDKEQYLGQPYLAYAVRFNKEIDNNNLG